MKICLFLISLLFVGSVYSQTIVIQVTSEEVKAVEGIVVSAQEWLQAAWDGKANKCMERIIIQETDKNPYKLTKQQKKDLIKNANFKTRKEKIRY